MASLELCPLSEHLEEEDIEALADQLEEAEAAPLDLDDSVQNVPVEQNFDDDVFVDFWDQIEANDAGCDVYLPIEFEEVFEVGPLRVGSAHALLLVLSNMKEDMFIEDSDDSDPESDDAVEDIDDELDEFDDYGAEDEQFEGDDESAIELKDEQLRQVWKVLNRAAKLCVAKRIPLFVHE